jgi:hypothetical protein
VAHLGRERDLLYYIITYVFIMCILCIYIYILCISMSTSEFQMACLAASHGKKERWTIKHTPHYDTATHTPSHIPCHTQAHHAYPMHTTQHTHHSLNHHPPTTHLRIPCKTQPPPIQHTIQHTSTQQSPSHHIPSMLQH